MTVDSVATQITQSNAAQLSSLANGFYGQTAASGSASFLSMLLGSTSMGGQSMSADENTVLTQQAMTIPAASTSNLTMSQPHDYAEPSDTASYDAAPPDNDNPSSMATTASNAPAGPAANAPPQAASTPSAAPAQPQPKQSKAPGNNTAAATTSAPSSAPAPAPSVSSSNARSAAAPALGKSAQKDQGNATTPLAAAPPAVDPNTAVSVAVAAQIPPVAPPAAALPMAPASGGKTGGSSPALATAPAANAAPAAKDAGIQGTNAPLPAAAVQPAPANLAATPSQPANPTLTAAPNQPQGQASGQATGQPPSLAPANDPSALQTAQTATLGQLVGRGNGTVQVTSGSSAATASSTAAGGQDTLSAPSAAAAPLALTPGSPGNNGGAAGNGPSSQDTPSTDTQSASVTDGTQNQVALGLLGDQALPQQVPVTAQGVGAASSGAVLPPGMDPRTLAIEPSLGGNAVATGDMAATAASAATQGIVPTEESGATNSSTAPLPQAATASPAEQIKVQLSKGLKDGSDTINVLLHPEDLGTVEVKLQMQDGQVKATITADNADTLMLLKNDAHQLQQSLQSAGFNTDANSLSFQLRDQQQGNQFAQQGQNGGQKAQDNPAGRLYGNEESGETPAATQTTSNSSGLDISV